MIVLERPNDVEIDDPGLDAQAIHDECKTLEGFSGVTISSGRVYLTFLPDTLITADLQLSISSLTISPIADEVIV